MSALDDLIQFNKSKQNAAAVQPTVTAETKTTGEGGDPLRSGGYEEELRKLERRKQELTAGLDLDGAAEVQRQIDQLHWDNGTHLVQRVGNTLLGAGKQSAASWGDSVATAYEAGQPARDEQNRWHEREYKMQYEQAERGYRMMLEDNAAKPGSWSHGDLEGQLNVMADAKRKLDAMGVVIQDKVQEQATEAARDTMRQVAQSGGADIEKAKEGLGAGGRFLVDVGVAGTQLATDAAANYLLFGGLKTPNGKLRPASTLGAKLSMGGRIFGGSTMEARESGASLGGQVGYGAAMTALELLTEKLGDGLDAVYGEGATSQFTEKLISKLGKTPNGQRALRLLFSAGGEGAEELVSGVVSPALQSIYDGKAVADHYSMDTLTDAAYDALVGGVLGGVGGAAEVVGGGYQPSDPLTAAMFGTPAQQATQETAQETPPNAAGERTATQTGEDTAQTEKPAEGTQTQDALAEALFGQDKENAASEVETEYYFDAEDANNSWKDRTYTQDGRTFVQSADRARMYEVPKQSEIRYSVSDDGTVNLDDEILDRVDRADYRDFAKAYASLHLLSELDSPTGKATAPKPITVKANGNQILITQTGINDFAKKIRGAGIKNKDNVSSLLLLDKLIENATPGEPEGNKHGGANPFTEYTAAFSVGGRTYRVSIDIKNAPNGDRYHYHALDKVEVTPIYGPPAPDGRHPEMQSTYGDPGSNKTDQEMEVTSSDPIMPQSGGGVNREGMQSEGNIFEKSASEDSRTNTVGAAEAGFLTSDSRGTERVSNIASGAAAFTRREGEATGLDRADYDALFRYQTETEEQRRQYAGSLLYYLKDGERVFLGDLDPEGYQELVEYLTKAPAWNGVMTDTAMLIKQELQGRALADPMFQVPDGGLGVTQEDYTAWLQVLREHATDTGRGTQAWAAWTRRDNDHGQATELEAWENLENSNLSDEERREVFDSVVKYDRDIEQAKTTEDLAGIIMRIADHRGTTHGLTGKQSKRLTDRARKALDSMSFAELKQLAYSSSAALTTDRMPADAGRKLKAIQILNMLSSPKTAATNLAGNTSFYGIDAMAMRGAAVLDTALSKLTGTRSVAMEGFWGSKQSRSDIVKAIRRSLAEITLDVDMGGEGRYQQGSRRTFKANGPGVFNTGTAADRFAERVLSVLERNMGYAMTTTDEGYKGAARSTAHATQRLVDEGKIKTKNKDYAADQADELAKYRTFQRDGYISDALQVVHDWLNAIPLLGIGDSGKRVGKHNQRTVHSFGVGDLVAPFTRVAGNLVSTAVDYNPAKAIQGTVEIIDAVRKAQGGDIDPTTQAKAVSDTARGLTGTAISLAAMALVKAGLMKRAEDEDDEDVAALNQSEGMTGTQINVDAAMRWVSGEGAQWQAGDTLVDVSRLEPLNFLFSFGVELADNENDGILSTVGEVAGDAAGAFVSAAGDLPVMGTVAGIAKDVLVYGDDIQTAAAENLGKTAISSVTPNIMAAAAKGLDDKQRSTYSGDGVRDVLLDTLLSRIPGARQTLPAVVNTLGEEKDNPGSLPIRLFKAMLNPVGVNEYSQSAVSQEMERVREKTGETGFYPSKSIPTKLSYTKDGVQHEKQLTWEQRQQYQMARSGAQMSVSAALLGSSSYRKADAKTQAALLDRAHDYANQFARGQVLGADSVESWVRNSQTAQADIGVSQAEFFALYEKYGSEIMGGTAYGKTKRMVKAGLSVDQWAAMKSKVDADGSGNVKKSELETYIERHFPRAKWRQIFDAYKGGSNWKNPY